MERQVGEGVATVYLNRPPLNALGATMPDELIVAADALSENSDVRAAIDSFLASGPRAIPPDHQGR